MRAAVIAGMVALAGCEGEREVTEVRFVDVPSAPDVPAVTLRARSAADARVWLLDAIDRSEGTPAVVGEEPWRTRAMVRGDEDVDVVVREGRTYAVLGKTDLRLDVRLGLGKRGAFAGGTVESGGERAMVQVRVDAPDVLPAQFRIAIVADDGIDGAHPREVTPRYLARGVPRGRYLAPVDVPRGGGRYLVGVTVIGVGGDPVAHAWSSPIAVVRPWL